MISRSSRCARSCGISQDPLSLDSPVGEDEANLGDFIEDPNADVPVDVAARHVLGKAVLEALDDLNDRERDPVRFGLNAKGKAYTLEEVGRNFGVSAAASGSARSRPDPRQAPPP